MRMRSCTLICIRLLRRWCRPDRSSSRSGESAAQRVLYGLGEEIMEAIAISNGLEVEEMYAFAPTIDVHSMLHERQRTRLYIS